MLRSVTCRSKSLCYTKCIKSYFLCILFHQISLSHICSQINMLVMNSQESVSCFRQSNTVNVTLTEQFIVNKNVIYCIIGSRQNNTTHVNTCKKVVFPSWIRSLVLLKQFNRLLQYDWRGIILARPCTGNEYFKCSVMLVITEIALPFARPVRDSLMERPL